MFAASKLLATPGRQYKPHQVVGINWMLKRESASVSGGLLCDDMGLGKTEQILGLILNTTKVSTLLLCPKPLIAQWVRDCIRCKFAVHVASKGDWSPVNKTESPHRVYITNYDTVSSKQYLFKQPFDRLCLDEAHQYLCNRNGKMYQRVSSIKRKSTWPISATPVVNSTKDLTNLLALVGFSADLDLQPLIGEALLHRSMEELRPVLTNLPAAAHHTMMSLDFETEEEREFYQGIQGKLVKRWRSLDRDQTTMRFQLLMKLRQLSIHPQIYIGARKREPFGYARDSWYAPSTKFTAIQKLVSKQTGVRWIIFCQFRDEMDLLENELSDYTVIQYHGGLTEEQKVAALKATEEPVEGNMVLLLNIKSGGVGLNLQHFTNIIFVSPWWTSALMRQAVGRAVRIGQTEKVQVYHMILKEEETLNIDAMMRERMEEKEELLVEVLKGASRGLAYVTPTKRYEERQEESMEPETPHPADQEVNEDP